MPTCPSCGHSFALGASKTELEIFIKENQPNFKPFSLKRHICQRFGIKKFADLPQEKYTEALAYVQKEVTRLTTIWASNKTLESAIDVILKEIPDSNRNLRAMLKRRLEEGFGETHWAALTVEQATEKIKQAIGGQNIWEYAYKPVMSTPRP